MKIKKLLIVGLASVGFLATQSCTDLEPELFSTILPEELKTNPELFKSQITLAYNGMVGEQGYVYREGYWNMQTGTTDEAVAPTRGKHWDDGGVHQLMHKHTWTYSTREVEKGWSFWYDGVSKSNEFLKFVKSIKGEPPYDAATTALVSEAKVLRAFYHYLGMEIYGNIPIDTGLLTTPSVVQVQRANVYEWIVEEINKNLPYLEETHNYGRFTQPAAYALLARIYLNAEVYKRAKVSNLKGNGDNADYQLCIDACDAIIGGGYGYRLESDYSANFAINNQNSKEIIFPIVFDAVWAPGNMFHLMTQHYVGQHINNYKTATWNGFCTLPEFYDSYLDSDAPVKITQADYVEVANLASDVYKSQLKVVQLVADTTKLFKEIQTAVGETKTQKEAELVNKRNELNAEKGLLTNYKNLHSVKKQDMAEKRSYCKDKRRDKTWQAGLLRNDPYQVSGGFLYEKAELDVDLDSIKASESYNTFKGARFKKFEVEKGIGHHANNDFPLFRYADILLMKAEAIMRINANGGTPTSQIGVDPVALVNEVRARAGADLYTAGTLTFDELLAERGRELAWEGTRRTDLIRFDKFTNTWRFKGASNPDGKQLFPSGETDRYRMLMPIPKWVIDRNPDVYTQNEGYK